MALNIPLPPYEANPMLSAQARANAVSKSALENMYYGNSQQSQIDQRNALAQQTNIANEYAKQANPLNLQQLQSDIQKKLLINKYFTDKMRQLTSGNQNNQNPQGTGDQNNALLGNPSPTPTSIQDNYPFSGSNALAQNTSNPSPNLALLGSQNNTQGNQSLPPSSPTPTQAPSSNDLENMPYFESTLLAKAMDMPELNVKQKAYQEAKGRSAATMYDENAKGVKMLQAQAVPLDNLIDLTNDPEFDSTVGPVSSYFKRFTGNSRQQQLLGQLQSSSGEIAIQIAPSLGASMTGTDSDLINMTKANPNTDFPEVFRGKLKAQKLVKSVLTERMILANKYIDSGMDQTDAQAKAAQETPLDKYKPIIDDMIKPRFVTIKRTNPETGQIERRRIAIDEAKKMGIKGL